MSTKSPKVREPLPAVYYYFFWLCEPALTLAGAEYAIRRPQDYGSDMLPVGMERSTAGIGRTIRGQMIIGGLGSCFFLLALISLSLFPTIKRSLPDRPDIQGRLAKALLIPLAIADISHIVMTLLPMPISFLQSPGKWTTLINGNVWITVFLFLIRSAYLLGIGRPHRPFSPNAGPALAELEKKGQ
ncbi:hypothetical protein DB88DRAFT_481304 [Papiliotrema laurentii]|uniref:DUF7704 domain-containing protein n=1 Tax=Papiliotrema laurentii TaxID=5418 RepID=A0AAD9FUB8_PAPLA|nr:hypothetical protein DB88DRAFT_481304 [Papiliotrema laurentii]